MSLGSIVNVAAGKIGEILVEEGKLLYGVKDQVESLKEELTMMSSFLIDMDEEGGDERIRTTIKQIRKIAYDAEDVIESYILEASSSTNMVEDFFKRYVCFCNYLVNTHQVGSEVEAIKVRIGETLERWKKYLGENGIIRSDASQGLNRARVRKPISYVHKSEEHVIGLDGDTRKLVAVLSDKQHTNIKVVSIVGMGGSGKTTLARKLYNNKCVKQHFDCVIWVSVSQQWVVTQILLELLRQARGISMSKDEALSLEELVEKLHQCLEGKRYLIVLDDVWTKQALQEIISTFAFGNDGKKIIVTTRKRDVVDFPDLRCFIHEPRRLSEGESWELFRKIALIHREESDSSMDGTIFESLGKEMLEKCEGLPLAVVALAGILGKKESLEEWEKIKKAVSSRIMEDGRGTHLYGPVNEMLALSYNDLPCELKPCFLYLAIFPEDSEIKVGQLIRMWIAEGFITSDELHEGEALEDVARGYLDELIHRCMVQIARKNYQGKVTHIRIHDLVRDLCLKKAKQQDFLEINSDKRVTKSRRAAIYSYDRIYKPFPTKSKHLRSLAYAGQKLSLKVINQNFRLLRVLLLECVEASDSTLPTGIGSLIHLRYLGLKKTNIKKLPSSVGNLRNLLTLDCRDVRVHDVVWKMEGLRYLCTGPFYMDNIKLHTLKHLQTLKITIGGGNWMLKGLPCLSESVQKLSIHCIQSQEVLEASFQCPSICFDRLHSLELWWMEPVTLRNLKPIIHSQHLRKLTLRGTIEDRSSDIQLPNSIKKLELSCTMLEAEATLVALGKLPQLSYLNLSSMSYMGRRWTCSAGEFPQLKELTMQKLRNLEEWSIERGAMPRLMTLEILCCVKLKKLPEEVKFITTLQKLHLDDGLENRVKEEDYVRRAAIYSYDRIKRTFKELWWSEPITLRNLKPIIHSQHLRKLTLGGRIEDRWSDIQLPNSIKKLKLIGTMLESEAMLVALGKLPQLSYLKLSNMSFMGIRWTCRAGEFPQLKELTMIDLSNLEGWKVERGAMPQLLKFELWS